MRHHDTKPVLLMIAAIGVLLTTSQAHSEQSASQAEIEIAALYVELTKGLPQGAELVISAYPQMMSSYGAKSSLVDVPDIFGDKAMEVKVLKPKSQAYSIGLTTSTIAAIQRDDFLCLTFWARGIVDGFSDEPAVLDGVGVQQSKKPYTTLMRNRIPIVREWRQYSLNTVAHTGFDAGKASVFMHLGQQKQHIQIGPVFLFNLGQSRPAGKTPACGSV